MKEKDYKKIIERNIRVEQEADMQRLKRKLRINLVGKTRLQILRTSHQTFSFPTLRGLAPDPLRKKGKGATLIHRRCFHPFNFL